MRIENCLICGDKLQEGEKVVRIDLGRVRKGTFKYSRSLIVSLVHLECLEDYLGYHEIKGLLSKGDGQDDWRRRGKRVSKGVSKDVSKED